MNKKPAILLFFFVCMLGTNLCHAAERRDGQVQRPGLQLHYRLYGQGQPLLLLSGGPGYDCDYLDPVAHELASTYLTVLVELRGTGRSLPAEVTSETVNLKLYLADLEALRESLKLERWAVLGHSAGANLAMQYAIAFPERISALVLANAGPSYEAVRKAATDNIFLRLTPEEGAAAHKSPSAQTMIPGYFYDREKAKEMITGYRDETFHQQIAHLLAKEEMAPGMDLRPALRKLAIPALIVAGRQDPMDPGMQYETHLALKDSRLVLLDRCGHFAWLEQPAGFYQAIREFLPQNAK